MLTPVANHQSDSHLHKRNYQYKQGWIELLPSQYVHTHIRSNLTGKELEGQTWLSLPDEVQRKFYPGEEHKTAPVLQKVGNFVTLVSYCGGYVFWAVPLDMVAFNVVIVI